MPWVRIDERFSEHPKIVAVGARGLALQIRALCYSNRNLTDGRLPRGIVAVMAHDLDGFGADDMVAAGLWETTHDGFLIHDFNHYQPSSSQVRSEREAARSRMDSVRSARRSENVRPNISRSSPNPVTDPVTVTDTETREKGTAPSGAVSRSGSDEFPQFWQAYPRHIATERAERAFRAALKRGTTLVQMLAALGRQKAERDAMTAAGEFVPEWPYPATWLNGGRWKDEALNATAEAPRQAPKAPGVTPEEVAAVDLEAARGKAERREALSQAEAIALHQARSRANEPTQAQSA